MTEQQKIIYDWSLIHEYAKGKSSAEMMVEVGKMDALLDSLPKCADMPSELMRFVLAKDDPGCMNCWLSSRTTDKHPECQIKIKEWFEAREALVKFGLREFKKYS